MPQLWSIRQYTHCPRRHAMPQIPISFFPMRLIVQYPTRHFLWSSYVALDDSFFYFSTLSSKFARLWFSEASRFSSRLSSRLFSSLSFRISHRLCCASVRSGFSTITSSFHRFKYSLPSTLGSLINSPVCASMSRSFAGLGTRAATKGESYNTNRG